MPDQDQKPPVPPPPPPGSPTPPPPSNPEHLAEIRKKIEAAKKREEESTKNGLQDEIDALKKAVEDEHGKALRALADLQNARKRMEEEKMTFVAFAAQQVLTQVIDAVENFHRFVSHAPSVPAGATPEEKKKHEEWQKGLLLINQQFQKFFEQQGVKKIEVKIGDPIDPSCHEAVMSAEGKEGTVVEVLTNGYELRGRVIRTAKVKVGRESSADHAEGKNKS